MGGVKLHFYDSMGHFWGNYLIDLVIYVSLMKLTKYRPFRATINTKNNFCRKILEIFHFQQFSPYLTLKLVSERIFFLIVQFNLQTSNFLHTFRTIWTGTVGSILSLLLLPLKLRGSIMKYCVFFTKLALRVVKDLKGQE